MLNLILNRFSNGADVVVPAKNYWRWVSIKSILIFTDVSLVF